MSRFTKSEALYKRATKSLAGGVSSEFRKMAYPHPLFYDRAEGVYLWDVDGNRYLDYTLSQGPMIVGHSHPHVLDRVAAYSKTGQLFAGQHLLELELAEKLQTIIPCAELMRFCLSGSEADHTAIRLARAKTGRNKFLRFEGHYHGWFDNVAQGIGGPNLEALGPRENPRINPWTAGLPDRISGECMVAPWNDLRLLTQIIEENHEEIAAIITEPVMCNAGCILPEPGFMEGMRKLCDDFGIVLIFDEVITGFRLSLGGGQDYLGVTPDLAIFGKAMASGYPISVLAGKESIMRLIADGTVIHAGTMNSCNPCVAAAMATLEVLEKEGVYSNLYDLGNQLRHGMRSIAERLEADMTISGTGPVVFTGFGHAAPMSDLREFMSLDAARLKQFVPALANLGIRIIGRGIWYISTVHTKEHIDEALTHFETALQNLPPKSN